MTNQDPQPAADDVLKHFAAGYERYTGALQETYEASVARVAEAQNTYRERSHAISQRPAESMKIMEAAMADYVKAVRTAWDASQEGYTKAFGRYLKDHQEAWMNTDLEHLSPAAVAAVAQSAYLATGYANATIRNWLLVAHAGIHPFTLSMAQQG